MSRMTRSPGWSPALLPALAMVVTTALMSGCAVQGPDYQRPAVELPADYPEAPANATGAAVAADWWKLFGDTTLNDLVRDGLARTVAPRSEKFVIKAFKMGKYTLPFPIRISDIDAMEDEERMREPG